MADSNNWRVKRDPSEPSPFRSSTSNYQKRRSDGSRFAGGRDQGGAGGRYQGPSTPSREGTRKPTNGHEIEQSIDQGRRLYVGNLPYEAKTADVEAFFDRVINGIKGINISIDPLTGRNPSYCFVDFENKAMADETMAVYNGRDFMGRPAKIKPATGSGRNGAQASPSSTSFSSQKVTLGFDRWQRPERSGETHKDNSKRLFVGGLPRFNDEDDCNLKVRELFKDFNVVNVSKPVTPPESKKDIPGNHYYCFVDLATSQECEAAIERLEGVDIWNWRIKVGPAFTTSGKINERRRLFVAGLPNFPTQEATEHEIRDLFAGYDVTSVSKLFLPKEQPQMGDGNHCYCFVELADDEQAVRAKVNLDWKAMWGGEVRVKSATPTSRKSEERTSKGWRD